MNILKLIQSQFSSQTIGQISNTIGESPDATKSALDMALPGVLGALVGKASSTQGAGKVFDMVKQGADRSFDSVGGLVSSLSSGGYQSAGNTQVNSIMGGKAAGVAEFISNRCGIKPGSAASLLSMAAPLVMGFIGKQVSSAGLGSAELGQLLASQASHLKDVIPSGLANTLELGNLLGQDTAKIQTVDPAYVQRPVPMQGAVSSTRHPTNVLKWAVPLILALGLGIWFFQQRSRQTPAVGGTADELATRVQSGREGSLAGLQGPALTPGSTADKLAKAISSGNFNQPLDLQEISFDASGNISDQGRAVIQQIGSVLKRVPNIRVTIIGSGSTDEASLAQANAIRSALVSAGVPAERLATRGEAGAGLPRINLMR